jgi:hypothetical protein
MALRFVLGLGLAALLLLLVAGSIAYGLSYARRRSLHRKRAWRRRGKKLRIDDFMLRPDEAGPSEP